MNPYADLTPKQRRFIRVFYKAMIVLLAFNVLVMLFVGINEMLGEAPAAFLFGCGVLAIFAIALVSVLIRELASIEAADPPVRKGGATPDKLRFPNGD